MASNCAKVDQGTPTFNSGEMVLADFEGKKCYKIAVICPDLNCTNSKSDNYTKVKIVDGEGLVRFYYVQMVNIESSHEEYWLPEFQLKALCDDMKQFLKTARLGYAENVLECTRKILEKSPEERLKICKMRAKTYHPLCLYIPNQHLNARTKMDVLVLTNGDIGFEFKLKYPYCLEQQMKKMSLDDQNDEIRRLKAKIADLEETKTELYNRNDRLLRNFRDEQLYNDDLRHLMLSREKDDANEIVIEELKAKNMKLSKENAKLIKANEKCKCKK